MLNLNLIDALQFEAYAQCRMADYYLLNEKEAPGPLNDAIALSIVKSHVQAHRLMELLKSIHLVASNIAAGNTQDYIDGFVEESGLNADDWDPFDEFGFFFCGSLSLPVTISQYAELVTLAGNYSKAQQAWQCTLRSQNPCRDQEIFDELQDAGSILTPNGKSPDDVLEEILCEGQIENIEIEYCLDGYDAFYSECREAFANCNATGDIKTLCSVVLSHIRV